MIHDLVILGLLGLWLQLFAEPVYLASLSRSEQDVLSFRFAVMGILPAC